MISGNDRKLLREFGLYLAELRKKKNLSQRKMSYACDIDYSKIAKIEKGKINITLLTILELAKALEMHPKELLEYYKLD